MVSFLLLFTGKVVFVTICPLSNPYKGNAFVVTLLFFVCRLVHSGSVRSSPALGGDLVFATRTGTGRGIESHVFRVETHWDLSTWTRVLVQGGHSAAELIKEVSIGVCLCLHYTVFSTLPCFYPVRQEFKVLHKEMFGNVKCNLCLFVSFVRLCSQQTERVSDPAL